MSITEWNADLYESRHSFVWKESQGLVDLLAPQSGERILDLGCGTGQLTHQIAESGAVVTGLDSSEAMVEQARQNYPHVSFDVAQAQQFQLHCCQDAVFSNAVLHWVTPPDAVVRCIRRALREGGRFVAEFGGYGNVNTIVNGLIQATQSMSYHAVNPWYFPSIGTYATLLETYQFEVVYSSLRDRPIELADGEAGLANWIQMFGGSFLATVPEGEWPNIIRKVEEYARPKLYRDGRWTADYRRLCIVAIAH